MALNNTADLHERILGLLPATVVDNSDPDGLYRVKVQYVIPSGEIQSAWARMVTRMAGPMMGWTVLPEPDDEVLLRFVNGHSDQPVIVGAVHNGVDVIPFDNADGKNDDRIWYSRNQHQLTFHDGDGAEFVRWQSTDAKTTWELRTAPEEINLHSTKDIVVSCNETLTVTAGTDVTIEAGSNDTINAGSKLDVEAGSNADISGSAGVSITASNVSFKA